MPPRSQRSRIRPVTAVLAGAVAVAVVAIAIRTVADRDEGGPAPSASAGPGVTHVHGLGINPADDSLVIATHSGTFTLAPGADQPVRIGDSFQDTMGFTVVGPDHFLGSGHPDVRGTQAGLPSRLGLIESTDGGVTWTIISLGGEADFHALASAHGQVYGWESGTGRFMVSPDRLRWEERASLPLFGFAVDPGDGDHVVGAGPQGVTESTDGGRTWVPGDGPSLVVLSWDQGMGLWGAEAAGTVWRRTGEGWRRAGTLPGQAQALLAVDEAIYAAVHDAEGRTAIYRSTDEARTWVLEHRDPDR